MESGSDDPKVHARSALPRAVTPTSPGRTRQAWRVSRNFALDEQAGRALLTIFTDYYRRVQRILETMQDVLDADDRARRSTSVPTPQPCKCAKIIRNMVADETGADFGGPHPQAAKEPAFAEQRRAFSTPIVVSTGSV